MFQKLDEFPSKNVNRKLKLWFLKKKKICPRLPLEIGTIDLYSMGEKVCLETVSSDQVDFKRHVETKCLNYFISPHLSPSLRSRRIVAERRDRAGKGRKWRM